MGSCLVWSRNIDFARIERGKTGKIEMYTMRPEHG